MSKSRARFLSELLGTTGLVKKSKSALAGADEVIDLSVLPSIPNSKLTNSSITINSSATSLGGSVTLTTANVAENTNLYFTNARADARITAALIDEDNMSSDSATRIPSQQSVKAYVDTEVAGLVDSAPGTLNTLNELAAALGDDANFSTTVTNSIATKLPLAGGTLTGNLNLGDNGKAIFGAGSDLQIYHSGSHSFISESGTGDLYIGASNNIALMNAAFSENKLLATTDGALTLYHNGSAKLATTASGIDVTGSVTAKNVTANNTAEGDTYFTGGTANSRLLNVFTSTHDSSANAGHNFKIASGEGAFIFGNNTTANLLTVKTGGIDVTGTVVADGLLIGGSGVVKGERGTASAPAYSFSDDADTGMFNISNADLGFSVGGTERMRIDSSGNVGIGTDSPVALSGQKSLTINGTVARVDLQVSETTTGSLISESGYIHLQPASGGKALIGNGGSDLVVDSAGNVGIGTNDPSAEVPLTAYYSSTSRFHIGGAQGGISNNVYYNGSAYTNSNTGAGGALLQLATDGSFAFRRATSGSSPTLNYSMYIDSAGKVGIGTTTPQRNLTVIGAADSASDNTGIIQLNVGTGANTDSKMTFGIMSTHAGYIHVVKPGSDVYPLILNPTGAVGGKVGIGTTAPTHLLHIKGPTGGSATIFAESTENNQNASIWFGSNSGGTQATRWEIGTNISAGADLEFYDRVNNSSRMVIEPGGNVGIGTISPAWALDVRGYQSSVQFQLGRTDNSVGTTWMGSDSTGFYLGTGTYSSSNFTIASPALKIDTSGRLGVVNNSPASYTGSGSNSLVLGNSSSTTGSHGMTIVAGNQATSSVAFSDHAGDGGTTDYRGLFQYVHSDDSLRVFVASLERMRITAAGDVYISQTNGSSTTEGHILQDNGKAYHIADGNNPLHLTRLNSHGDIQQFYVNTTHVGSIGSVSYDAYFNTGDVGIRLNDGNDQIWPVNASGASRDAAIDLGNAGVRFKDLHLSGGIRLSGSDMLNYYEKGSWTPKIAHNDGSGEISLNVAAATYVRIGSLCYVQGYLTAINPNGNQGGSGAYYGIRNFPFQPQNYGVWNLAYASSNMTTYGGYSSTASFYFLLPTGSAPMGQGHVSGTAFNAYGSGLTIMFNATYYVHGT